MIITNVDIYQPTTTLKRATIQMNTNGEIADIHKGTVNNADINGEGLIAIPGFIDGHIHGAAGKDAMDANYNALETIASALPEEGTTSFLATTMTQSKEAISSAL